MKEEMDEGKETPEKSEEKGHEPELFDDREQSGAQELPEDRSLVGEVSRKNTYENFYDDPLHTEHDEDVSTESTETGFDQSTEESTEEPIEESENQQQTQKKERNPSNFSMKIGTKIALGFLLVILIFGFVSSQTWLAFDNLEEAIVDANEAAQQYNRVTQMDAELRKQYGYVFEYANLQQSDTLENYENSSERFEELFARISEETVEPEAVQALERIRILKDSMDSVLYESIVPSIGTDGEQFMDRRLRNVESRIRYIGESFDIVSAHTEQQTQTIIEDAETLIADEKSELLVFLGIALAVAVTVTAILSRGISKPLKELQKEADRVSEGDLTLEFKGKRGTDEIGELAGSFGKMSQNLKVLITSVKEASGKATQSSEILMETAKQSSGASEDLSKTIQEIAETADNQAQNTTEGTQKVNEMASTIEDVSKSTDSLRTSTENANRLRAQGVEVVSNLSDKTQTINQVTSEVSKIIQETDASTEKINKASIVIQSISEQTGLLALNAAIESARAGEAGRGFAVVAEEIRKLADQASDSTKEIEDIVKGLKEQSNIAVRDMKNLEGTIGEQGQAVKETQDIFNDLSNAINSTKKETDGVENYVQVMLDKKGEIVDIINQLASIAEENAASTEEASAATEEQTASLEEIQSASEQLTNLSYELQVVVEQFKV